MIKTQSKLDSPTVNSTVITRRRFTQLGIGAAAGLLMPLPTVAETKRFLRVAVMSDIHIGRRADDLDGSEWLTRGLHDIEKNIRDVDFGVTLGDITHHGDRKSLETYLRLRDKTSIPTWLELAGNHEHRAGGIQYFKRLIRDTTPYCHVEGNIAWFLVSDESEAVSGQISQESYHWLTHAIKANSGRIIIVCSHQPPPDTIRRSSESTFCLHPRQKIRDMVSNLPIDLWLCGHEHHRPYSSENSVTKGGTTCINVASMTHAYGTLSSGSMLLEISDNSREIIARRRNHDRHRYDDEFTFRIPLNRPVRLDPPLLNRNI